jgi:hypothetical protein
MAKKRKPTVDELYDRRNDPGPESRDLSMEEVAIFENARNAVGLLKKTFETWTVIGKAVVAARTRADRVGGGKTFRRILDQQGLGMVVPPATATRLEAIMASLVAVEEWRAGLTDKQRFNWASPSAVFKRCPVFAKDRATLRPNMTSSQPAIADPKKVGKLLEQQDERIKELEKELEAARELAADGGPLTIEQVTAALIALVQDEPMKSAKAAMSHISKEVTAAWYQRRHDGVPVRDEPTAKKTGKARMKKDARASAASVPDAVWPVSRYRPD